MKTIEFLPGCTITSAVEQLVVEARLEADHKAQGDFNGITLTVDDSSTVEGVVAYYHEECGRRAEAYRNSPEGKKAAREAEERKQKLQRKCDTLMQELPNLDFTDYAALLDWLCKFQNPSDHIGVRTPADTVLATFAAHGYQPGVNCGKDFNGDDRDNFARWLIGQALDGLQKVGAIHQVVHKFTDDWKKKFIVAAA